MLVLSRKLNQEIQIGENITITVLKVKGNTVRLGIKAPRKIHVVRGEIRNKPEVVETEVEIEQNDLTVVFENAQTPKIDLIPFEKPNDANAKKSIKFEQRMPRVAPHNRLKEIVSQMTQQ